LRRPVVEDEYDDEENDDESDWNLKMEPQLSAKNAEWQWLEPGSSLSGKRSSVLLSQTIHEEDGSSDDY
jgi:hypothetical protein